MTEFDDISGHAQPGDEHATTMIDDRLDLSGHVTGHGGEQIDAEGLVGRSSHCGHLRFHTFHAHGGGAHAAEAAGLTHSGDESAVAHATHSGEHHWMLDLEDVSQSCLHGDHGRRQDR